jgi:RNA polymerase sigma-70 factor, ECF subfamily
MLDQLAETEFILVQEAQDGNRNAFGELVRMHYPGVTNVVYRLCGDDSLAQDSAQEAFLRAWQHLSTFRPGTSFRNWLYRIAVNAALDTLRRKEEANVSEDLLLGLADNAPDPEAVVILREQAEAIQQALNCLTEATRSVIVLREYGDLSYQEIAGVLDIPIGTVMSRLNYARSRLRDLLMPQMMKLEVDHA